MKSIVQSIENWKSNVKSTYSILRASNPRLQRYGARSGAADLSEWVIAAMIGLILFAIAIAISAPLINGLTTGATPLVGPTTTTGTLVGYVLLFVVLGFILAILAGALYIYRHNSSA